MALNNVTLTSGMRSNLFSLQQTASLMETAQRRLSSGKRVESALDDPINFFTAQEHTMRADDLSTRKDGMSEAIQTVKAANNGIEAITDLIAAAKSLAQSALSASACDAQAYGKQYTEVLHQIDLAAADSGYKGINLLDGSDDAITVQFAPVADDSSLTITGFSACTFGLELNTAAGTDGMGWLDGTGTDATVDTININLALTALDDATATLRRESKTLATSLNIVTTRQEYTTKMINTLSEGAAALTNADMNEEGANMLMLQTRQSLGTTSLSMASQAAQSVLRLF
jgi:flagellin-like hook-associated protein FlgL